MTRLHGAAFIVAATVCWSTSGILIRSVSTDVWTTMFWRSLTLAVVLGAYLVIRHGRRTPDMFRAMGGAGVLSALLIASTFVMFVLSITTTLVANAMVIMSSAPLISAVLGRVVLGERIKPLTVGAIAAALCGIGVMVWGSGNSDATGASLLGGLYAFGVAFAFGANIVVVRAARHVDLLPAMSLAGLFAALATLPLASPMSASAHDLGLLVLMGVFQLALGLFLFLRGAPYLLAAEVGLLTLLEVVLAPLWVWIGIGEEPSTAALIGGGIVITALATHSALGIRRSKPPVGMA